MSQKCSNSEHATTKIIKIETKSKSQNKQNKQCKKSSKHNKYVHLVAETSINVLLWLAEKYSVTCFYGKMKNQP